MAFRWIRLGFRAVRFVWRRARRGWDGGLTRAIFYLNNVQYGPGLQSFGVPVVDINDGCRLIIGRGVLLNNGPRHNRIGRQQPCFFIADLGGIINIGDGVGMSGTALVCHRAISIGNNVRIGGNTVIYDTDFHELGPEFAGNINDNAQAQTAPVSIGDGAFIGAHVTILKGVQIGAGAVIGAGSVVTKSVPAGEVWGGNPARCLTAPRLSIQP